MPLDGNITDFTITTAPPVFSLDGLIMWLEQQPGETEYSFSDCTGGCLLDTYLTSRRGYRAPASDYGPMVNVTRSARVDVACNHPRTYAAALERAYTLRAEPEEIM